MFVGVGVAKGLGRVLVDGVRIKKSSQKSNKRRPKREIVRWERANRKETESKPMLDIATWET
jgi:hypothetical protein